MTKPKLITYNGKTATIKEWAAELGISPIAVKMRFLRHGTPYPKERAITAKRIAEEHGISPMTIYGRIYAGKTLEEALVHPKFASLDPDAINVLEINGVTRTKKEWIELNGISRSLLSFRLKRGWSLEEAVTIPPRCKMQPTQLPKYMQQEVEDEEPRVLVEFQKHQTVYWNATSKERLLALALRILEFRMGYGFFRTVEEIQKELDKYNTSHVFLSLVKEELRHSLMAEKAIENNDGALAWLLLNERTGHEYERIELHVLL
jgi:hypothetical protein